MNVYSVLLKNVVLPIADKAMKTCITSSYRKIRKLQHYTAEGIAEWQRLRLKELLEHAYKHTRYYHELFDREGLRPEDIRSLHDLQYIPILTKTEIRKNFHNLISNNLREIPHIKSATGGSTGDPLVYLLDLRSWSMSAASTLFNWEKAGYNFGDRYIALGSTSLLVNESTSLKHLLYYRLKRKTGLNGINMSNEVCKNYLNIIKQNNIRFIYGYASSIYLLAKYASKSDHGLNIHACFPTSEVLTDRFRETIRQSLCCKIMDGYGAIDGGVNACSHKRGYYEVGYNCIVRVENPDSEGTGPALLTDLFNYAMPLINYSLGDAVKIDVDNNKDYPYNGQLINQILGRTSDIIQLENGNVITGPGFTVLFRDLPVEHYCIERVGINAIKCSIVKLPGFAGIHEDLIISTLKKQMGHDTSLNIHYVDVIPLTKSGKRQYFKK